MIKQHSIFFCSGSLASGKSSNIMEDTAQFREENVQRLMNDISSNGGADIKQLQDLSIALIMSLFFETFMHC